MPFRQVGKEGPKMVSKSQQKKYIQDKFAQIKPNIWKRNVPDSKGELAVKR